MLGQEHEPSRAEKRRIYAIHHRVQDVYPGERDVAQRLIGAADARHEPCCEAEDYEGVDVVGELEGVEVVAGEDGEDAVEAGGFVDYEGEGDEFGGGSEGDEVEEGLCEVLERWCVSGQGGAEVRLVPIRGAGLGVTYPWFGEAQDRRHGVCGWRLCSCRFFTLISAT